MLRQQLNVAFKCNNALLSLRCYFATLKIIIKTLVSQKPFVLCNFMSYTSFVENEYVTEYYFLFLVPGIYLDIWLCATI